MARVLLSLGSNIEPEQNLKRAVQELERRVGLLALSPVYETAPVGKLDQPNFLNAAALIETMLPPQALKARVLQPIEKALGRVRTADKNAPRTIDLDIALYGDRVVELGPRHIPDPHILRRAHVAVPLADLAPDWPHPETGQTLREIAEAIARTGIRRRPDLDLSSGRGV